MTDGIGIKTTTKVGTPGLRVAHDIGWAVKELWSGNRVTRFGWNGRNMWLQLQIPDKDSKMTLPYVYMRTAGGDLVPWLCSQTDLLAIDWSLAE